MPATRLSLPIYPAVRYCTGIPGGGYSFFYPPIGSTNTLSLQQSVLQCFPWPVSNSFVLLDVGIEVSSAVASTTARLGVYYDNGNTYPGALLQDFGVNSTAVTINCNQSAGVYMLGGLVNPLPISAGFYWMGIVSQGGIAVVKGQTSQIVYNLTSAAQPTVAVMYIGYSQSGITGALPTTFTTTRTVATIAAGNGVPRVIIKIQ